MVRTARRTRHGMVMSLLAALLALSFWITPTISAAVPHDDATCPDITGWLAYINTFRSAANIAALTEDTALQIGDCNHSRYVVKNSITHNEDPANPWYTATGAYAGTHSNVAVSFGGTYTYQDAINEWMTGPFHETGILDPRLTASELALYIEGSNGGATLDVLTHDSGPAPGTPTYFPANGKQMTLLQYGGNEGPDPLTSCGGYTAPTGPPLSLQLLTTPAVTAFSFSKTGVGALPVCEFDQNNYSNPDGPSQSLGRAVLGGRNAIILMPQAPLTNGSYQVSVTSNATVYSWSFYVGPAPAAGTGIAIYRPSAGAWYLRNAVSTGAPSAAFAFGGAAGDLPLMCNWTGDGHKYPVIFRPSTGAWYFGTNDTAPAVGLIAVFGTSGDKPVCGDWTGSGKQTIGVFRNGTFYLSDSNTAPAVNHFEVFGAAGDSPMIGDWNFTGAEKVGIFRTSGFVLAGSHATFPTTFISFAFGAPTDQPLSGDWDNDTQTTVGTYRSGGLFSLTNTLPVSAPFSVVYGGAVGDVALSWK